MFERKGGNRRKGERHKERETVNGKTNKKVSILG